MTVTHLGYVAALVLTLACLLVIAALVGIRLLKDRAERRRLTLRAPVWRHVLTLSTGEADEVEEAQARLAAATQAERDAVLADAFALVPKLRGDARERLRDVLRVWGSLDAALANAASRSQVRRCRGVYRLGVLREPSGRQAVLDALADRDFAVRRTAVLAAAAFPDDVVVEHLLATGASEPRLRREFLGSIDRIGSAAIPVLRGALSEVTDDPDDNVELDRRGYLAAAALGLVGAIQAVPDLEAALDHGSDTLKVACIYALGELGAGSSVIALSGPLGHRSPDVRMAAARALGLVGGDWAVPALATTLYDDNVEVARAAANALRRCGPRGREVLDDSRAPVALEVVALAGLGTEA
ncbi:HEAT repeat domain-containing protein [Nocardioides sp. LS1]|uniref:HEAT repeat domain-containing protein n=1 Tax=Nocardioides sp. LS1 TaxID=1027620 RepID=UPI000F619165|nr:HEAT repeat domain-containing protein [Nocardioides sp. LS1]GCD88320.1 hypothetical protein NLS1_03260 [Nocardioides sp. LS1]